MTRWFSLLAFVIFILTGCSPAADERAQNVPLPTLFPTATPEYNNPYAAELVARSFLDHWQNNEFEEMYSLLSFASQQASNLDTFRTLYENAHNVMRLSSVSSQILAQSQDSPRVMEFIYNVTFDTRLLGTFSDNGRSLHLVMDDNLQSWRVAWSPGDIFAEMGSGGLLRFATFPPRRGNIYDSEGNILADMNGIIVTVNIIRGEIPQIDACVETLSQVLGVPADDIRTRLNTYRTEQLAEVGFIEPEVYQAWQAPLERDCAARFDNRPTRRYIDGELMPHIIGFVGYPDEEETPVVEEAGFPRDAILGRTGVERSWDETLRGRPGGQLSLVTPDGNRLRLLAEVAPQPSQSVFLTIDTDLQRYVLKAIADAYAAAELAWAPGSRGAAAIVMDVNTGAILAMVSYPTFNANAFTTFPVMGQAGAQEIITEVKSDARDPLLNRAAQSSYPTGSVMKIVTAIAALDSGVYRLDERYVSTGVWTRDIPRYDWLSGGHGSLTLAAALTHSCNTCFYEAGYRLDQTDPYLFSNYARRMGLSIPTGIRDIPESVGLIGNPDNKQQYEPTGVDWNFSDAISIAIGQGGVAVTPLQIVRIFAAVANGGTLYRPQLVQQTGLLDEFSYQMTPDVMSETGIAPEVIESVREGLCGVATLSYGTATHIFRDSPMHEIGMCGKTGTATAGRGNVLPHAWFGAYAPRENPEIAVVVVVENSGDGSAVAAPITRRILEYYFFGIETP